MRAVQQRLRRDTAHVEAGAAEGLVLLDDRDFHAELRRADGADIAARPRPDHHKIIRHGATERGYTFPLKGGGRSVSQSKADGVGVNGAECLDPHPDPPPCRGRERTESALRITDRARGGWDPRSSL